MSEHTKGRRPETNCWRGSVERPECAAPRLIEERDAMQKRAEAAEADMAGAERDRDELLAALRPIAAAYPDDPGTSDLDNEQPVTITLGDVRRVWIVLAKHEPKKESA